MTTPEASGERASRRPLRLWPGIVIVTLQWLGRFVVPVIVPEGTLYGVVAALLCGPAVVVWWAFFSRAPRIERWGGVVLMIVALAATPRLLHESVAKGNMGFQFFLYVIPVLSLALVGWAVASRRLADGPRRATLVATILLACGPFALLRSRGITGDGAAEFEWRWAETPEERLLAQAVTPPRALPAPAAATALEPGRAMQGDGEPRPPSAPSAPPAAVPEPPIQTHAEGSKTSPPVRATPEKEADWPGLRGRERNGVVRGVRLETDWSASPPLELWRRPIGPGVSSFAVRGDRLYTQEQAGPGWASCSRP